MSKGGKCIQSVLVYGISGVGKTTQIGKAAEFVYNKTGKKTRLASTSGGGWGSIDPQVELGIVEPCYLLNRKYPYETLQRMSRGWWPEDANDSDSPLVEPSKQKSWADVGALAFDSVTEGAEWVMRYSVEAEAKGVIRISGQQPAAKFQEHQGGDFFGSPSMGMYGTIQNYFGQFVAQSTAIPGRYIFWTALELKGTDENTRLPLYGPEIIGKAKTSGAPAWFNHVLHLCFVGQSAKSRGERRMYFESHFEEGIPCLAKNTASLYVPLVQLNGGKEYLEGDKVSLDWFLSMLEESKERTLAMLKESLTEAKHEKSKVVSQ